MKTTEKIEKSFAELSKMGDFQEKYGKLIKELIRIKKELRISGFNTGEIILDRFWHIEYPNLGKDLLEVTGGERLLGFDLKLPSW